MKIHDSRWLVTGASCGIGREIARALAGKGARLALASRGERPLQQLARELAASGADALAVPMDVTSDKSVATAMEKIAAWGGIDGLANVAGNGGRLSSWAASDTATTQAMFEVHVLGADRVTRAALPGMKLRGGGVVVNIASTVGWVPMPGSAAYSAAKAAVIAMSQAWRSELRADGIDVRLFAPPHTRTEAGMAWPLPLPRVFAPDWVAHQFVRFVERDRPLCVPGGNGALLVLQRLAPRTAQRIMDRIGFEALRRAHAAGIAAGSA